MIHGELYVCLAEMLTSNILVKAKASTTKIRNKQKRIIAQQDQWTGRGKQLQF